MSSDPVTINGSPLPSDDDHRRFRPIWLWPIGAGLLSLLFGVLLLVDTAGSSDLVATGSGVTTQTPEAQPSVLPQDPTPTPRPQSNAAPIFVGVDTTDSDATFERADEVGQDPFVSPQELMTEFSITFPPAENTSYGLFGGTLNNTCNPTRLADYLEAHPDKAQAWAGVMGVATTDLRAYIMSLTPTVLTADTRVTNHGFANGVAIPIQATLEAGTAVLVDNNGVPRSRCYCGNPLLPPDNTQVATPAPTVPTPAPPTPTAAPAVPTPTPAVLPTTTPAAQPTTAPPTSTPTPITSSCAATDQPDLASTYHVINVQVNDPDGGLVIHSQPGLTTPETGVLLYDQTGVQVTSCAVVTNTGRVWWELAQGGWVSAAYLAPDTAAGPCGTGAWDPTGKNVVLTAAGDFNGDGTQDEYMIWSTGADAYEGQVVYGAGGVSVPVQIQLNARDVLAFASTVPSVAAPSGAGKDILNLESWDPGYNLGRLWTLSDSNCEARKSGFLELDPTPADPRLMVACPLGNGLTDFFYVIGVNLGPGEYFHEPIEWSSAASAWAFWPTQSAGNTATGDYGVC